MNALALISFIQAKHSEKQGMKMMIVILRVARVRDEASVDEIGCKSNRCTVSRDVS